MTTTSQASGAASQPCPPGSPATSPSASAPVRLTTSVPSGKFPPQRRATAPATAKRSMPPAVQASRNGSQSGIGIARVQSRSAAGSAPPATASVVPMWNSA